MSAKLAVIIPAFNCERTIVDVVRGIPDFIDHIIVVDDGSTDNTYQNVMNLGDTRVQPVVHKQNRGVGAAVMTGYRKAMEFGADILIKMDGDGQMKPDYLPELIRPLTEGKAHYAKGNRFTDYRTLESMPPLRRFGNSWLSFLSKLASGYWKNFDVTNGYTAILSKTWNKINPKWIAQDYFFETSMLIALNIVGAKVVDVDMPSHYEDHTSHLKIDRVLSRFPRLLVKGLLRRFYRRYLLRDFNALSLCILAGVPLFIFGIVYGFSLWIFPPQPGIPTPAGTVMLAALPIILGFQLLMTGLILDVVFAPNTPPSDQY